MGIRALVTVIPWLAAMLGGVLVVVGVALLAGGHLPVRLPSPHPNTIRRGSTRRMVAFGAGYAIASASCTLAVLLAVVSQATATTGVGMLAVFAAYAAGSAVLLLALAVLAAAAATALTRLLRRLARYASRLAGGLLAVSGGYLLYYWLPPLLGGTRPSGGSRLAVLAGRAATWITTHQAIVLLIATGLILTSTAIAVASRRRTGAPTTTLETRPETGSDADCCPPSASPHIREDADNSAHGARGPHDSIH
ncbi:MAG: cytochrome C biogenesis protein [Streptosporangiales bacterium]|nr:cytochrome C biogenesis protein [Streptosporangiales bacterium]